MGMKIDEIREDLKEKVIEMKVQGHSISSICDFLNQETDQNATITPPDVFRWFSKEESRIIKVLKEKGKFDEKVATSYFNTIDQMKNLNTEMWEEFYNLKEEAKKTVYGHCKHCQKDVEVEVKDYAAALKIADHLLKQLQHVDAVLGKLMKKSLTVNYNITDINAKIQKTMPDVIERMEREGTLNNLVRQMKRKKKLMVIEENPDLD